MLSKGLIHLCGFLLWAMDVGVGGCKCPQATILAQSSLQDVFLNEESCCLNYSGSALGSVTWSLFSDMGTLEILDLSGCNITHILGTAATSPAGLRKLYLGRNMIRGNFLERLPEDFLRGSSHLHSLLLDSNRLSTLPRGLLRSTLEHLELSGNPWDCACPLVEELQGRWGNDSSWQQLAGNLTCFSPKGLAGRSVWSVQTTEVCHTPGLTALFILLPILLLLTLGLCWCCGRKRKRKEGVFRPAKWGPETAVARHNGLERQGRTKAGDAAEASGKGGREVVLKNQLMMRPSSDLLSSSRDLYEEVEVKLGSTDSLAPPPSEELPSAPSLEAREHQESQAEEDKPDLETVSVTEVMKDSADREKAYLVQSTEYYSLVPGIDLEDSDHADCEYESVDLS
ncbi:hypothetical protein AGOR_G00243180 [Albula goreensis]|uniref:LRRCT domain-containing protein n=1 Tax=Albula goreensis TaxID=1534307 RepID=A0A8T3CHC2_9TELE|nr:hypothetical protein AGOR_G00243180 [Albula goreensis]